MCFSFGSFLTMDLEEMGSKESIREANCLASLIMSLGEHAPLVHEVRMHKIISISFKPSSNWFFTKRQSTFLNLKSKFHGIPT